MQALPFACSSHWAIYQLQHRAGAAAGQGGGLHLSVRSVVALAAAAIAIAALAWIAGGRRGLSRRASQTRDAPAPTRSARTVRAPSP
jgi:hypothetical protein